MSPDSQPAVPELDLSAPHPPGLAELLFAFAKMSLAGFGGVLVGHGAASSSSIAG